MKATWKLWFVAIIFLGIFNGCEKENDGNDGNGDDEWINVEAPKVDTIIEKDMNGRVFLEVWFENSSIMYFRLLKDNTAEVTHCKDYYGEESDEGYYYRGDVVIPAEITHLGNTYKVVAIGTNAFSNCRLLHSIAIPNTITLILSYAFYGCSNVVGELKLPNSVTEIGYGAFCGCRGLTSLTIPNSVTMIGRDAFSDCDNLKEVTCLAIRPPECDDYDGFLGFNPRIIRVPAQSIDQYRYYPVWRHYADIIVGI